MSIFQAQNNNMKIRGKYSKKQKPKTLCLFLSNRIWVWNSEKSQQILKWKLEKKCFKLAT